MKKNQTKFQIQKKSNEISNNFSYGKGRKAHEDANFTLNFDTEILQEFEIPENSTYTFYFDRILRFCIHCKNNAKFTFSNSSSITLNSEEVHVINCRNSATIYAVDGTVFLNICPYASSNIATAILSPVETRSTRGYTYYSAFYEQQYEVTVSYSSAVTLSYLSSNGRTINMTVGPAETVKFTGKSFVLPNAGYLRITTKFTRKTIDDVPDFYLIFRPFFGQPLSTQISEGTIEPNTFSSPKYAQIVSGSAYVRKGNSVSSSFDYPIAMASDKQYVELDNSTWLTLMLDDFTDKRCDMMLSFSPSKDEYNTKQSICFFTYVTEINYSYHLEGSQSFSMDIVTIDSSGDTDNIISVTSNVYKGESRSFTAIGRYFQLFIMYDLNFDTSNFPLVFPDVFYSNNKTTQKPPEIPSFSFILFIYGIIVGAVVVFNLIIMWIFCASYCCPCKKPEEYVDYLEMMKKQEQYKKPKEQDVQQYQESFYSSSSSSSASNNLVI